MHSPKTACSDNVLGAGARLPLHTPRSILHVRRSLHQFVPWGLPRPDEAVRRYVSRQAEHLSSRLLPELGTHLGIEVRHLLTLLVWWMSTTGWE